MKEELRVDGVHMHLENKKISRRFFWLLWLLYAVVYMTKSCYSAAMASIVSEGILTKSQTGLINAAFYGVYAPLQIVGGIFADKYNPACSNESALNITQPIITKNIVYRFENIPNFLVCFSKHRYFQRFGM